MPYKLIKGTFHLVGLNKKRNPVGFEPDGDSIQFKPNSPGGLDELEVVNRPYKLTQIGSVNLRFEGIDATELHYSGARQPYPIGEEARDFVTGAFGMNPVTYISNGIKVKPPANDGQQGYILSKQLDYHGRPVSFVFVGTISSPDGKWIYIDSDMLKQSLNYKLLQNGLVYPLFYDTLYHDLRETMRDAAKRAFNNNKGLWPYDWSNEWIDVTEQSGVEQEYTIFTKIFRRLTDFHKEHEGFVDSVFVARR
ncbi:MAG: hypothetical protein AB1480_11050 [Nitrospirota bacterium]